MSNPAVADVRDMAITHADFLRLLACLQPGIPPTQARRSDGALRLEYPWEGHPITILLGAELAASMGALSLTRTRVELDYGTLGAVQCERFRERFDRCFQRGGG